MSEEPNLRGFRVKAPKTAERLIPCDEMIEVSVRTFVFRRNGREIERIQAEDLERPPTAVPEWTDDEIREQGQALRTLTRGNFGHHSHLE
jgi:hypothetical protein